MRKDPLASYALDAKHDLPPPLGDLAAEGDQAAARTAYQASHDIRTRLAAADPANTGWQRDLSVSRQRLEALDGDQRQPRVG